MGRAHRQVAHATSGAAPNNGPLFFERIQVRAPRQKESVGEGQTQPKKNIVRQTTLTTPSCFIPWIPPPPPPRGTGYRVIVGLSIFSAQGLATVRHTHATMDRQMPQPKMRWPHD